MRPERSSSTRLRASWVDLPAPVPAKVEAAAPRRRVTFGRRRLELSLCTVALAAAAGSISLVAVEADPGGAPRRGPPAVIWLASGASGVAGTAGLAPTWATGAGAVSGGEATATSDAAAARHRAAASGAIASGSGPGAGADAPTAESAKAAAAGGKAADASTGRIVGRVVGLEGPAGGSGEAARVPASGVVAVARPKKGDAVRAEVDPEGRFELAGLAPGPWMVTAEAPSRPGDGFASTRAAAKVEAGKTAKVELGLVVARQGLTGQVLAEGEGQSGPIPGARVTIELGGQTPLRRRVRTEADGSWAAGELPEGVYSVRAEAEGFVSATRRRVAVAGGATVAPPLRLATEARLTGAVRGPDGQPAARVDVVVLRERRELARARTDRSGVYTIARLADGPVDVLVTTRDRSLAGRASATVGAGRTTTVDLALAAPPRIAGRVVGVDGQPRAGVRIDARARDGRQRLRATSGADGSYALAGLAPGGWVLTIPRRGAPAAARASVDVPEAGGADVRCDLVVKDGAILRGSVVGPDGGPLAGALVVASVGGKERSRTRSDAQGAFQLVGLQGGDVNLFVRGPKDACVGTQDVVARADALTDGLRLVARPPARVRGQVTDPDGLPLAGVAVALRGGPVRRGGKTDDAGRFDLGPLYDGAYELSVDGNDLSLVARRRNVAKVVAEPQALEVTLGRDVTCAVRSADVRVEQ